jgi:hypothetical protein
MNCAIVICPVFSAFRPNCTPALPENERAKPVAGSMPSTFLLWSATFGRRPVGLAASRLTGGAGSTPIGALTTTLAGLYFSLAPMIALKTELLPLPAITLSRSPWLAGRSTESVRAAQKLACWRTLWYVE